MSKRITLGSLFDGIEKDDHWFEVARNRIEQANANVSNHEGGD